MVSTLHPLSTQDLDTITYGIDERPFGDSYKDWTERWWNWFVGIPHHRHPAKDPSGNFAHTNQTNPNVFFLAGAVNRRAVRTVKKIPKDKAILMGILVIENSLLEWPGNTINDLQKLSKAFSDDMISLKIVIDEGKESELVGWTGYLCKFRIISEKFDLDFIPDNLYVRNGGKTLAAADGYWVFLKEGVFGSGTEHTIAFEGIGEYYSTEAQYRLAIE